MRRRLAAVFAVPGVAVAGGMDAMGAAAYGLALLLLVDVVGCLLTIGVTLFARRRGAGKVSRGLAWVVIAALLAWGGYIMSFGGDMWRFWIGPVTVGALCVVGLLSRRRSSPAGTSPPGSGAPSAR